MGRFPRRYVGVLFAYFDYLLEYLGSDVVNLEDLSCKITSSKQAVFSLFVLFLLVIFLLYYFFLRTLHLFDLMELADTLKVLSAQVDPTKKRVNFMPWQ